MTLLDAILLGTIQGLTEFLPVSSSGHLVLTQSLFGLTEVPLLFDVSLHVGTLVAVLIVYCQEILSLIRALPKLPKNLSPSRLLEDDDLSMIAMILIGSIPTAVIGLGLNEIADTIFTPKSAGFMLLITATFLWISKSAPMRETSWTGLPTKKPLRKALMIGTIQGMAVLPGISRSGSTIVAAQFLGFSRETAARFSFLLSLPAILGAELLGLRKFSEVPEGFGAPILLGTLASFIVGYLALRFLIRIVKKGKLHWFAPYCAMVGMLTLFLTYS